MSTSKLQRRVSELLSIHLGQYTIRENTRPDWLVAPSGARLELDFYIEELDTAIEVQGSQHYIYTPHFHKNYSEFRKQVERDRFKHARCVQKSTTLFAIVNEEEATEIIFKLAGKEKEYPIHPNAIAQGEKEYTIGRKGHGGIFGEYPSTVRKHLKRMRKILLKTEYGGEMSVAEVTKLNQGIRAIVQYQESTDEVIDFDSGAYRVLLWASVKCNPVSHLTPTEGGFLFAQEERYEIHSKNHASGYDHIHVEPDRFGEIPGRHNEIPGSQAVHPRRRRDKGRSVPRV